MDLAADSDPSGGANLLVSFAGIIVLGMATVGSVCCYRSCIECVFGGIVAAAVLFCVFGALRIKNAGKK